MGSQRSTGIRRLVADDRAAIRHVSGLVFDRLVGFDSIDGLAAHGHELVSPGQQGKADELAAERIGVLVSRIGRRRPLAGVRQPRPEHGTASSTFYKRSVAVDARRAGSAALAYFAAAGRIADAFCTSCRR